MKKLLTLPLIIAFFLIFSSCFIPEQRSYRITETYRITSSKGTVSLLSVELPISYGYQVIGNINVKNVDDYSFEEKGDYRTLCAIIKGSGDEKTIFVEYDVTLQAGKSIWREGSIEGCLDPEEFIDSDNQSIIDLANTLKVNGDKHATAKNIFRYLIKNIKTIRSDRINKKTLKASEVLQDKKGVCIDYANLMTALLRASGIPAKSISGLALQRLKKSSNWSSPADSHAWVEFNINGEWYFADPTWGWGYYTYSHGFHLSYGTQDTNVHTQNLEADEDDTLATVAWMTAPIRFKLLSEDSTASITPRVDIAKIKKQ
ncbi:MAG: transglutaminase-like domain-containing protein [Bacteroidales bacterium]|jgi:hypothetical protein|nr:transglutaminase-like domain-containing protein [Bacteroidales bacterium]MDD3701977.1 transglutaminase-like domain-containing protein [Bacteroidales bacterium]MDY0368967.1 transglutaminase-like domain-containing protein [Bacteroidales bacterium]